MNAELKAVDTDPDTGVRFYEWDDGKRFPSVTTILDAYPPKKRAIKEFEQQPGAEAYRDRQATLGRIVHHRILDDIAIRNLDPPRLDMDVIESYDDLETDISICKALWEEAQQEYDIDPGPTPAVEEPVRHNAHEYAGRFDLLTTDGTMIDLKVSPQIHDSYKMQLAAYITACAADHSLPDPDRGMIVGLHPHADNNPKLLSNICTLDRFEIGQWFHEFTDVIELFND